MYFIEKNKKSLSVLKNSYQNINKKNTLEIGQELLILIEEFTEISYHALKNEIKANEKQDWKDWITSYLNTVFIKGMLFKTVFYLHYSASPSSKHCFPEHCYETCYISGVKTRTLDVASGPWPHQS